MQTHWKARKQAQEKTKSSHKTSYNAIIINLKKMKITIDILKSNINSLTAD